MTTETSLPVPISNDPEIAFAAMARKLAGLTAAIDGFALRQQEIQARDYTKDLIAIGQKHKQVRDVLRAVVDRPGIALGPKGYAEELAAAAISARQADHQELATTRRALDAAIASIASMVASARKEQVQANWIVGVGAATLLAGFVLGVVVPTMIDRIMPEDWHWPEQSAAGILGRDEWGAGERLMQVADPARWQGMAAVTRLAADNADVLSRCRATTVQAGKAISCTLKVVK